MAMNEKRLGLRLQAARKKAGLTQQQLCQKSGLSYSTLAKIERGAIKSPSVFTVQHVAVALDTTIDELVGELQLPPQTSPKKISKSGVSFVYFDVNGCLVGFFHRAFTKISVDLGLPLHFVETTCWNYNDAVCRGDITIDEYNQTLAQAFQVDSFDWASYYLNSVDPIPEARELAAWAAEHFRIGLITNIMPGLIDEMIKRDLLPNLNYDVIADSSIIKAIKPEPSLFEEAGKKADVPAEQILFVDDSRANLMAAQRFGWQVSWFDDFRPKESADHVREILEF